MEPTQTPAQDNAPSTDQTPDSVQSQQPMIDTTTLQPSLTPVQRTSQGLAITSLVLSSSSIVILIGTLGVLVMLSMLLSCIGLVLGVTSLAKRRAGKGMAVAGVVLSSFLLALIISYLLAPMFIGSSLET